MRKLLEVLEVIATTGFRLLIAHFWNIVEGVLITSLIGLVFTGFNYLDIIYPNLKILNLAQDEATVNRFFDIVGQFSWIGTLTSALGLVIRKLVEFITGKRAYRRHLR
ncbi:hypothetical protein [Dehalococcoides mccartyi]|jgi:hypothetical protein|uniref:hypothetical protein n=1 Tax=Dehalococcoides mccartyi TaxID=61435 RepID=UPI001184293C|nr:hypothetical protein [Dehalococcoides mccartyi]